MNGMNGFGSGGGGFGGGMGGGMSMGGTGGGFGGGGMGQYDSAFVVHVEKVSNFKRDYSNNDVTPQFPDIEALVTPSGNSRCIWDLEKMNKRVADTPLRLRSGQPQSNDGGDLYYSYDFVFYLNNNYDANSVTFKVDFLGKHGEYIGYTYCPSSGYPSIGKDGQSQMTDRFECCSPGGKITWSATVYPPSSGGSGGSVGGSEGMSMAGMPGGGGGMGSHMPSGGGMMSGGGFSGGHMHHHQHQHSGQTTTTSSTPAAAPKPHVESRNSKGTADKYRQYVSDHNGEHPPQGHPLYCKPHLRKYFGFNADGTPVGSPQSHHQTPVQQQQQPAPHQPVQQPATQQPVQQPPQQPVQQPAQHQPQQQPVQQTQQQHNTTHHATTTTTSYSTGTSSLSSFGAALGQAGKQLNASLMGGTGQHQQQQQQQQQQQDNSTSTTVAPQQSQPPANHVHQGAAPTPHSQQQDQAREIQQPQPQNQQQQQYQQQQGTTTVCTVTPAAFAPCGPVTTPDAELQCQADKFSTTSGLFANWKHRTFKLTGNLLSYHAQPTSPALGSIPIAPSTTIIHEAPTKGVHAECQFPDREAVVQYSSKKLLIRFADPATCQQWIAAMRSKVAGLAN